MKRNNFLRFSIPILSVFALVVGGCGTEKSREQEIVGEWSAHWETKFDESMPTLSEENLTMNGVINFKPDGKVDISAYGYEGCIFSDDTIKNTLNWKIDDSVFRFIDSGDDHGLPYTITKFSNKELELTLLEDISLTLQRNN